MHWFFSGAVYHYIQFVTLRAHQLHPLAIANEGTQLYMSGVLTVEYIFHPVSLILIYFSGEGAVRFCAAFLTAETLPSLPLKLFVLARDWRRRRMHGQSLGPIAPDRCESFAHQGYDLRIACSRPKDGWRVSTTIAVEHEFYEIIQQEEGMVPHSFVYLLRKLPPGKIIRGIYRYDPPRQA